MLRVIAALWVAALNLRVSSSVAIVIIVSTNAPPNVNAPNSGCKMNTNTRNTGIHGRSNRATGP